MFLSRVDRLIATCGPSTAPSFAVLFLDVDRFAALNDDLGRPAGDALLVGVARRLGQSLRPTDAVARAVGEHTLARLGGDEFTVLLHGVRTTAEATCVARRLLAAVSAPFQIRGADVALSCSIGLVMNAPRHACADDMVRDADVAMRHARAEGCARVVAFEAAMRARAGVD